MARSTFKVLFYVNGNKEKNDIVRIIGRVTINGVRKYVISTLPLTTSRLKSSSTTCVYSTVKRS